MFSPKHYQYYTGQCFDSPEVAISKHNSGKSISTKKGAPWQLVYSKSFDNACESYLLMKKLQNVRSHRYMEYMIDNLHSNEININKREP